MSDVQQAYVVDGNVFETKAEAVAYQRRPKILNALSEVTDGNEDLSNWLVENQDTVEAAFEVGTVKRVKVAERKKLKKALDAIEEADIKGTDFVTENADQIVDSFRWPKVKRMNDEEKATQAKNTLMGATENNEELSAWIVDNQDQIKEAFAAGKPKREVSEKAKKALEDYRAKKAAEKAAAEEAEES